MLCMNPITKPHPYLKHWVIPQTVLGFASVIQLVLTRELVVSHILSGNYPPAPLLLPKPADKQILCKKHGSFVTICTILMDCDFFTICMNSALACQSTFATVLFVHAVWEISLTA